MTAPLAIATVAGFFVALALIVFGAWQLHAHSLDYDDLARKHDGEPASGMPVGDSVFAIAIGIVVFLGTVACLVMGYQ